MAKIVNKWWVVSAALLGVIYVYGYRNMFFHQDDLDWMMLASRSWGQVMAAPIGDHVNYIWRGLLKIEWELFGLQFAPYLAVSVGIHAVVIWLIYLMARELSQRADLAAMTAILFSVNTNWTETVLWMSGQTITITAAFVLLSMYAIAKKRGRLVALGIASWTSALALGLLVATWLTYPRKRWGVGIIVLVVGLIYSWQGTDGTHIEASWAWAGRVGTVMALAMVNTVVGRLVIPFDRFEMGRIGIVSLVMVYGLWRWRGRLGELWRDQWSRFLGLQIIFYYLIVAVGRAQYGVGIMRAERYSYLGLALWLLLLVRMGRKWVVGKWIWVVPVIVMVQGVGLYVRARDYVVRPQQMRTLFAELEKTKREDIQMDEYLPHFVLNDERLRYRDLVQLMDD